MSEHLELREAAELHRAEARWLDQCAARLRRAHDVPTDPTDRVRRGPAPATAPTAAPVTGVAR